MTAAQPEQFFFCQPTLTTELVNQHLVSLVTPGPLACPVLEGKLRKLDLRYQTYLTLCPFGIWAPGLVLTQEMRAVTDSLLPLAEIRQAFARFFALSLSYPLSPAVFPLNMSLTWLDFLQQIQPLVSEPNPATLLQRLMTNEEQRQIFLFTCLLPRHHGGAFGRYHKQCTWLGNWLSANRKRLSNRATCLVAACGTGEEVYELAEQLQKHGYTLPDCLIEGSSLEPLELFAACHGCFPHDRHRQQEYRARIAPLVSQGASLAIRFKQEDLVSPAAPGKYDLILCNGLLGGPFIQTREQLLRVIGGLARQLEHGGIMLAADSFHDGWKKRVSEDLLRELLGNCGLTLLDMPEGIGGVKAT